jgi:Zn-dependent peptidase ImmA (M78 family)/DNA-binding XRE family transcriptional regulator
MIEKFNYKNLILAREVRGLTQQELATILNFPQSTLSKIENGNQRIESDFLKKLGLVLDFPESFFCQDIEVYPPNLHYRKKSDVTAKILSYVEALMNIYRFNIQKLLKSIEIPFTRLPFVDSMSNVRPQEAAVYLRQFWSIPKGAIEDVTKTLEDNGILVIPMDFGSERIDGRSMVTQDGKFIIFINNKLSGDRQRYTLSHELAHVILHINSVNVFEVDIEKEAMVFASEFLMPEKEIRPQLMGKLTLQKLADLKKYWKVSMQAILYWAGSLKLVTENQSRYLWSQFNALRIRIKEPIDIPNEKATLLSEVIKAFIEQLGYTRQELAGILNISLTDFKKMYLPSEVKMLSIVR